MQARRPLFTGGRSDLKQRIQGIAVCVACLIFGYTAHILASAFEAAPPVLDDAKAGAYRIPQQQARAVLGDMADNLIWYDTAPAWILVTDPLYLQRSLVELNAATADFYRFFGQEAGRGAIVDLAANGAYADLVERGVEWYVPWPFRQTTLYIKPASGCGRACRAARILANQGVIQYDADVQLTAELVDRGKDAVPRFESPFGHHLDIRGSMRHEIAHALFKAYIWPGKRSSAADLFKGGTVESWLESEPWPGAPKSVAAMNADFLAWALRRGDQLNHSDQPERGA